MRVALFVIPDPAEGTRSVLSQDGSGKPPFPFMEGSGEIDLVCGQCGFVLVAGSDLLQFQSMVFKCPECGRHNESRL